MYNPDKKQPEQKVYGVKLLPLEGDFRNAINEHISSTIDSEEDESLKKRGENWKYLSKMPTVKEYLSECSSQKMRDTLVKLSADFERAGKNWDALVQQFNNEVDEIREAKDLDKLKQYAKWFEEIIEYGEIKSE